MHLRQLVGHKFTELIPTSCKHFSCSTPSATITFYAILVLNLEKTLKFPKKADSFRKFYVLFGWIGLHTNTVHYVCILQCLKWRKSTRHTLAGNSALFMIMPVLE